MTVTLDMLRALLERALAHTDNPALLRLPEGEWTVEGVARAYLARDLHLDPGPGYEPLWFSANWPASPRDLAMPLDLTDPGTAHALLVALALALGLDPGVGGLGVSWHRQSGTGSWALSACGSPRYFVARVLPVGAIDVSASLVAAESDPVRALVLAVAHVLGTQ